MFCFCSTRLLLLLLLFLFFHFLISSVDFLYHVGLVVWLLLIHWVTCCHIVVVVDLVTFVCLLSTRSFISSSPRVAAAAVEMFRRSCLCVLVLALSLKNTTHNFYFVLISPQSIWLRNLSPSPPFIFSLQLNAVLIVEIYHTYKNTTQIRSLSLDICSHSPH